VEALVKRAIENGINFFDHADIYGAGKSEVLFGEVLKRNPQMREKIIIQTKCGICKGYYDSSLEHILESVDKSLERLNTNYLDILLIHRPDTLMDVHEIAKAFEILFESGKVHYFGVSNMNPMQIELIQKHIPQKLIINQLQFNLVHSGIVDSGINVNMKNDHFRDNGLLEYCRINDITIQPWSVLQASWEEGTFLDNPNYQSLNFKLQELGDKYHLTPSAISLTWILRHPSNMQPIIGTTSLNHLDELCLADSVEITRQEYYELYRSAGHKLP
jgi:predicted oxidoreductase